MYEQKFAVTEQALHPIIGHRWSPRSFSFQDVSDADLISLLEAARWAASASNEQPWRFITGRRNTPAFEKILGLLVPQNQAWARKASVLMLSVARTTSARNGSPNHYHLHDTGAATAQLMLQAAALGLSTHAMAGFDHERAKSELNLPPEYIPAAAIAIGYVAPPDQLELPDNYIEMERNPRQRIPLSEMVFEGGWGVPLKRD